MPLKQTTLSNLWPAAFTPAVTAAREETLTAPQASVVSPTNWDGISQDGSSQEQPAPVRINTAWNLPPAASVEPLTQSYLIAFRRLIKTLLPVRYPDRTYNEIVTNPQGNVIARVLVWKASDAPPAACSSEATRGLVVGAICSRVQPVLSDGPDPTPTGAVELYVQMLGVLAPYRGLGLASALLREVVQTAATEHGAQHVFAHVWEANEDALDWYRRRNFAVEEKLVENYYRRLNPHGARIVRRRIGPSDFFLVEHLQR